MDLKSESLTIGDATFETTQFAAIRSLTLLARLMKTLGPAIGALKSMDLSTDVSVVAGALSNLEPAEAAALALAILEGTSATVKEGGELRNIPLVTQPAVDRVFSGRLLTMFKVLAHAVRVNYSDFGIGSPSAPAAQ